MFDIGWSELLVIGMVALIVIGPKELPGALRTMGQWMGKLRRMASEFQGQFQEAMREAEMADLKKQVDDMTAQAKSYANFDPMSDVRKELESTQQHIESAVADQPAAMAGTSAPPEASAAPGASVEGIAARTEPVEAANVAPPVADPLPSEPGAAGAAAEPGKPDAGGKPA